jgi:ABC-type glycerol-3-phosphate transport system substrate-binding protein
MNRVRTILALSFAAALVAGCSGGGGEEQTAGPSGSHEPATITVWDYYGSATPLQESVIKAFEQEYPWITVDYQAIGWNATHEKFTVAVSSGAPPDVATMDMTWVPTFASNGLFANLTELSGGQLNGAPMEDQYSEGALNAMTFDGNYVVMMFDFDVYGLYYRADQFEEKGISVPTTWEDMQAAAAKLAEDTNGDGTPDKFRYAVIPNDCFHWCGLLFQAGGSILTEDNSAAAFNGPEGLSAMEYYKSFIDAGTGISWGPEEGEDLIPGIKDDRVGMFIDGPYYMGLLKSGVPEQEGNWAVAPAPYSVEPGSYLGGTGLAIPVNAQHPQEAWLFVQYMLRPEQQVGVFTYAGAAPATTAALDSTELTEPDPYFGGQAPFGIFKDAMATATHFPYVAQWDPIDVDIGDMVQSVILGKQTPQEALTAGADLVNQELSSG